MVLTTALYRNAAVRLHKAGGMEANAGFFRTIFFISILIESTSMPFFIEH